MIVACTACQLRFEGASYRDVTCPSCGALAQPPAARPCPHCVLPLQPREVGDVVIDECSACHGLFLDTAAVHQLLADEHHARADAVLAALPRGEHHPLPRTGAKMYIKCPTCGTMMNRKLFATGSAVVLDVCKAHGTFFDLGELPAIIEFVRAGGLAKAAKLDAQRKAEHAKTAKPRHGGARTSASAGDYADGGVALVDLLAAIFE